MSSIGRLFRVNMSVFRPCGPWLLCGILALIMQTGLRAADAADIEAFVRDGCEHCLQAEAFLARLHAEQPTLRIDVHNVSREADAAARMRSLAGAETAGLRLPAFYVGGRWIIGYSAGGLSDEQIRSALRGSQRAGIATGDAGSCSVVPETSCETPAVVPDSQPERFGFTFLGRRIDLDQVGLPLFTLAMGLLDGFNPCSMWVLLLMLSMLAPMQQRMRMLAVAGTFVVVEGIAYFAFMAAWLNLFLLIGWSRGSQWAIAAIAIVAGAIHLKDFWAFGRGFSLSIPASAKPGIYARMRAILQADNLFGAIVGAVVLAVLVQVVEFMCTSGFPALYTRILTLRQLQGVEYYGYLLLYNAAYMLDDVIVLAVGVWTLSQRRLREREGRWLKLLSGLVMVGLGLYLLV